MMSAWRDGKVQWFDLEKGEGMIIDKEDGSSYYVHYSAIKSKEKLKKLNKGRNVKFQLYENLYMKQVNRISEI
jgi:cold shock CspA family protein